MHKPEVFTSDEKPGVVLLREGRASIQLDELERKALGQMNRAERRRYLAEHRKIERPNKRASTCSTPRALELVTCKDHLLALAAD